MNEGKEDVFSYSYDGYKMASLQYDVFKDNFS